MVKNRSDDRYLRTEAKPLQRCSLKRQFGRSASAPPPRHYAPVLRRNIERGVIDIEVVDTLCALKICKTLGVKRCRHDFIPTAPPRPVNSVRRPPVHISTLQTDEGSSAAYMKRRTRRSHMTLIPGLARWGCTVTLALWVTRPLRAQDPSEWWRSAAIPARGQTRSIGLLGR
jgi:hypothetical protein